MTSDKHLEKATTLIEAYARHRCVTTLAAEIANALEAEAIYLRIALDESVKLQSHYAVLLNLIDGGKRLTFDNAEDWLGRLRALTAAEHPK